jgi:hypothetical protein
LIEEPTTPSEIVELLVQVRQGRAVRRVHLLSATLLSRSHPRRVQPRLNVQAHELGGATAVRLLKAMRDARPRSARQFFGLAKQRTRRERYDPARRLVE